MDRSGFGQRSEPLDRTAVGSGSRLRFGEFELDAGRLRLDRGGRQVAIDPRPLALLAYLIEHRERVVSRGELFEAVWPGVVVGDDALASAVRHARRAIGDGGSAQRWIRTLRGVGYRFLGEVEELEAAPPGARFIGRREILKQLDAALRDAREGSGRCIWLAGDPGIGKSRLLLELERRAGLAGIACHFGRCLEEGGAAPHRPWQQIVRSLVDGQDGAVVERRFGRFAAEARRLLPEAREEWETAASAAATGDGPAERARLFEAVVELVRAAARETPRLLVIDDLHRADAATLELLLHVLREIPRMPVLLVGSFREREIDAHHPLAAALAESLPGVEHARLEGLAHDEVVELSGMLLGRPLSATLAEDLFARTDGNPLFVGEVVRGLGDALDVAAVLPAGVRHAIRARIAALPAGAAGVLGAAAVIGREFDLDVLSGVYDEPDRDETLDAALARGVIERSVGTAGRFRFAHILLRDVLFDDVPPRRRAKLHAAVGRAIERLRPDPSGDTIAQLAHHFGEAVHLGEATRAVRYGLAAGARAMEQAAYHDAAAQFEIALRALERMPRGEPEAGDERTPRGELLVRLGQARWRAGDTRLARDAFREAAAVAEAEGTPATLALAAVGYAGRTDAEPGVNEVAVSLLEAALAALPEADSALRSEVLARLGTELYYGDDPARCDHLTQEALEMAERLGDRDALAYALTARSYALFRPGVPPQRRRALYERTIELAPDLSDLRALGLHEKALCLMEEGDCVRLDDCLGEFDRVARELRQPFFTWMASTCRGARAFIDGRLDEAERLAQETLAIGQSFGTDNAFAIFSVQLLYVRREQGRMGELEPALRELLEGSTRYDSFRSALAAIYVQMGRLRDARDAFEQVMARDLDDVPRDQHWIPVLAMLTGACAALRDEARARTLYGLLLPEDGRMVIPGHGGTCDGAVSHHLARLAVVSGDFDAADEHFDAAVTLERRAGARLFGAHSQRRWAELLWKLGAPQEREKARDLAGEARATYTDLGLESLSRQAQEIVAT